MPSALNQLVGSCSFHCLLHRTKDGLVSQVDVSDFWLNVRGENREELNVWCS